MTERQRHDDNSIKISAVCPVCLQSNGCSSQQINQCWCQQHSFSVDLIDALKNRGIHDTCICLRCLEAFDKTGTLGT